MQLDFYGGNIVIYHLLLVDVSGPPMTVFVGWKEYMTLKRQSFWGFFQILE
jgi:hypothetical protein